MITNLHIKNFFSFKDCSIDLHPKVNILVGINGSGKSNFLKAFDVLRTLPKQNIFKYLYKEYGKNFIHFISSSKDEISLSILIKESTQEFSYNVLIYNKMSDFLIEQILEISGESAVELISKRGIQTLIKNKSIQIKNEYVDTSILSDNNYIDSLSSEGNAVDSIKIELHYISIFSNFDTTKNGILRSPSQYSKETRLEENGSNLPHMLEKLKLEDKTNFKLIIEQLNRINPNYINIDFKSHPNFIELWLDEKGFNKSVHVSQVSDGTLKFLCLMAIFYNPNRGSVICIDEPETGLHPDMLIAVADGIKFASETSQMIISTHSPLLLNRFELEHIRVFEKDQENATIVKQLNPEEYQNWNEEYTLGELWTSGHIGGNRW